MDPTIILFVGLLTFLLFYLRKKPKGKLPPGPYGLPFLGNLLQLSPIMHKVLQKWAKIYGSIFCIQLGSEKVVILDDHNLIKEMFSDPVFSGKPQNDFFLSISAGCYGVVNSEGQVAEAQRKFIMRHLREFGFGKQNYLDNLITEEVKEVLEFLKEYETTSQPVSMDRRFQLAVVNSLWSMSTGKRFKHDDPILNGMLNSFMAAMNKLSDTMIILFAPWLGHVAPVLSGWKALKESLDEILGLARTTVQEHKQTFSKSHIRDFCDQFINEIKATTDPQSSFYGEEGYSNLRGTIGDLFMAGSQTTSATLSWAVLYITSFPEVQQNFQKEIDIVIGKSRLPSLTDKASMPYTQALLNEVLRFSALLPTGVFHRCLEDKEFHGYLIPKGYWIIANVYSVLHNKELWGDPQNFRPERFLTDDGKTVKKPEGFIPFLIGKRICIGKDLAQDTLFLCLTSIYQHFYIKFDPNEPKPEFEPKSANAILIPHSFKVILKDRIL